MREREVESALTTAVRKAGGVSYKWTSPNQRGVPDRIVFLPGAMVLVEVKAPGQRPTPLQQRIHDRLRNLGQDVRVIDTKEQAEELVREICASQLPAGCD